MKYKELLDLGFERKEYFSDDEVWFDQYGYKYFCLELNLVKYKKLHIDLQWSPDRKDVVELIKHNKENVISRKEINTIEDVKILIRGLRDELLNNSQDKQDNK